MMADVNVTCEPVQTGFSEALMVMLTGRFGLTVVQIVFEVAGFPVVQERFDVRTQVIQSPFNGVKSNMGLFPPVLIPFIFH
jgi:hypothetical protein